MKKNKRNPDFNNLLKVLKREKPLRPMLFEFVLNQNIYNALTDDIQYNTNDPIMNYKKLVDSFRIAGYDFVTMQGSNFSFKSNRHSQKGMKSISINDGAVIFDRESYEKYEWPDPNNYDYSILEKLEGYIPEGMKIIVFDSNGLLEQVVELVGYENLCFLLIDDPELVKEIFDMVGSRLLKYHEICSEYKSVGAHFFGDDWGFSTQTLISPNDLRKHVVPWHKKMVEAVHKVGKPAILHSCGNLGNMMEDIIDDIKYDGKHSYEDKILRVEDAYERYGNGIAILGGLDVDFICRSTPEEIFYRAVSLLEKTDSVGYALGSGNSIPEYVPTQNYLAMIAAAIFN